MANSVGTVLLESTLLYEYLDYKILYIELTYNKNTRDDIIINPIPLFNKSPFSIIMGLEDALRYQNLASKIATKHNIMTPTGTITCKSEEGDSLRLSTMNSNEKINHLSNVRFPKGNSILVLGLDSMNDFKSCCLTSTKKSFLETDLANMIKISNTRTDVIVVISDELLQIIKYLEINLNDYFKEVINFPSNKLLECLDEMVNGKIIKTNDNKSDLTISIGLNNTILTSNFQSDINIVSSIGTKGRMRLMANSTIFSITFIIVAKTTEELVFKSDTEYIDLIINTNETPITNKHLNDTNLKTIIELSIDNDALNNSIKKIPDDIMSDLLVKYLINNSILIMFNSFFADKNEDIFIKLVKQLILTINKSNVELLKQQITYGESKMMQYYNKNISTNIPIMNRYSSVPCNY